jgi:hypothetical protein
MCAVGDGGRFRRVSLQRRLTTINIADRGPMLHRPSVAQGAATRETLSWERCRPVVRPPWCARGRPFGERASLRIPCAVAALPCTRTHTPACALSHGRTTTRAGTSPCAGRPPQGALKLLGDRSDAGGVEYSYRRPLTSRSHARPPTCARPPACPPKHRPTHTSGLA